MAAKDQDNLKANISDLSKQLGVANTVIDKLKDEAKGCCGEQVDGDETLAKNRRVGESVGICENELFGERLSAERGERDD